jgi:hypothetical protein
MQEVQSMRAFVDRIEIDTAVLLLGKDESVTINVPVEWLPEGVREGMCLRLDFSIDDEATHRGHEEVQSLLDSRGNEP